MKAKLFYRVRRFIADEEFVEMVVWEVPVPLSGSNHPYKYRLAYVENGVCVIRYDNEAGKGDHKHIDDVQTPVIFTSIPQLISDFAADVATYRENKRNEYIDSKS